MFPIAKTLKSIAKCRLHRIILSCALLAIAVVVLAAAGVTWLSAHLIQTGTEGLDTLLTSVAGIATGIGGWFMLPALIILIAGMFQETVINRVEKAFYPDAAQSEAPKFWPDFVHDLRFTGRAVGLNILVLPSYFIGIGFVISFLLNSYLLGREFFESAAGQHLGKKQAQALGKKKCSENLCWRGGYHTAYLNTGDQPVYAHSC